MEAVTGTPGCLFHGSNVLIGSKSWGHDVLEDGLMEVEDLEIFTWRIIPGLVRLITMVIVSPVRIGLWDPFQMAEIYGL